MTVSSTTSRITFAGNGATTAFATSPVVFFDDADLDVYVVVDSTGVATLKTITTHYTVTGGDGSTGTVTMLTAPAAGETLVVVRTVAATQGSDLVNNDGSDAEVVEDAFDRLTMLAQQNINAIARTVRLSDGDVSGASTALPTPVASKVLAWNSTGLALENADLTGVADGSITLANMANIATDRLIGRDTAATGVPEALTVGGGVEFSGSGGIQRSALTGDVTASAGSNSTTIANDAVTYAKMQDVSATDKVLGRSTAGAGNVEEITCTSFARSLLDDSDAATARATLGVNYWTTVFKTADETVNNSAALQDDDHLTFSGLSGEAYAVRVVLNLLQADAAADFKVDFNSLSGNTSWFSCLWRLTDTGGVVLADVESAGPATDMSMTSASVGQQFVEITLNFILSANASCTLRWAQNTATVADTVVKKGSYMEYRLIA